MIRTSCVRPSVPTTEQRHRTLELGFTSFFGELGIGREDNSRSCDATTHAVGAASDSASPARANSRSMGRTNPASTAGTNSTTRARAIGRGA